MADERVSWNVNPVLHAGFDDVKIQHIQQRLAHDCGIAALAMATGHQYEEILEPWRWRIDKGEGLHEFFFNEWFYRNGWAWQQVFRVHQFGDANQERSEWPPRPWAPVHLVETRVNGNYHFVVMDVDGAIFDPWDQSRRSLSDPAYLEVPWVMGLWKVHPL